MSDGTSLAVRPEGNLPAPVTPNTPIADDGGSGHQHTQTAVQSNDPDDIALAKARAEVAAEEAAARGAQPPQPKRAGQQPQRQPAGGGGKGAVATVPVQRFNELAEQNRNLRDQLAYYKGAAEARKDMATQQPPAQPQGSADQQGGQQPTIEQQIETQQATLVAAAERFDAGEITMKDFVTTQHTVEKAVAELRALALQGAQGTAVETQQPVALADQQILDRHQALLEQRFPWTRVMTRDDLTWIANTAAQEAVALGRPFGNSSKDTLKLRERVAQLSDAFGPAWYPARTAEVNALRQQAQQQPGGGAQPTPPANPSPQPAAAPPGVRKLEIAANHPPNINTAGSADEGAAITEARLNTMTTDEIAALPASVRSRFK